MLSIVLNKYRCALCNYIILWNLIYIFLLETQVSARTREMGCQVAIPPPLISRGTMYDLADVGEEPQKEGEAEEEEEEEEDSDKSNRKELSSPEYQPSSSPSDELSSPEKPPRKKRLVCCCCCFFFFCFGHIYNFKH